MLNRRMLLRAALVASLFAPLSLTACEGMDNPFLGDPSDWEPEDAEYVESRPIVVPEFDFLWERAKFMIQTEGYSLDRVRTLRSEKTLVSRWKTLLAPARFKGVRRRIWISFEESGPDAYLVKCCVQAQRNEDIEAPTEIAEAVWKALEGGDSTRANLIIYRLETGFKEEEEDNGVKEKRQRR